METGYFVVTGIVATYDEWHHFVADFFRTQQEDAIFLFLDGNLLVSDKTLVDDSGVPAGNGHVQIGRAYTDSDFEYGSVVIGEILFFNRVLKSDEIEALYKQYA